MGIEYPLLFTILTRYTFNYIFGRGFICPVIFTDLSFNLKF
nr:MAG TPA: hypothetical protein [Herelleviridae sp.]